MPRCSRALEAEQIPVRFKEGTVHGFLVLRTQQGETLAAGDLIQVIRGDRLISELVFHFKDGSVDDEITIFSQRDHFRLLSSHHVQKGPAFPNPMDVSIDGSSGEVQVRSTENGKDKVQTKHLDLPPDLANGLILTILKNIRPDTPETKLSRFSACAGEICRTKLAPYGCHRGNAEYGVILDCSGQWLQLSSMRLRIGLGIGGFRLLAHRPMTSGR